ncbi:MAG: acylphosphatase [Acetobacteraceae bacterium]|nr:acylphosphatase [Acetobacteraceae bacterium]
MIARRLAIAGRVQGVGFRDWLVAEATAAGLSGWVRNRTDGTVEALLAGEAEAVARVAEACRRGPPAARVERVAEEPADPPAERGFRRLPTR